MTTSTAASSTAASSTARDSTPILHDADPIGLDPIGPDRIGLDELLATAELQTRKDRKYLVGAADVADLLREIDGLRVLDIDGVQEFRYESQYFDTEDLVSYLGAAHRRPHRFKVRTRSYMDTETALLEVKVRDARGHTIKHRHPYDIGRRCQLTVDGRSFVSSIETAGTVVDELRPTLTTTYRRSTCVLGSGDARATVDTDIVWRAPDGEAVSLPRVALIETKTRGPACAIDRSLWRHGVRPTTISKYCTGLAALRPELPANKWHRVLWRHLDRRGAPTP
jgi:hypothetical protein